jgi:hypothetical protein
MAKGFVSTEPIDPVSCGPKVSAVIDNQTSAQVEAIRPVPHQITYLNLVFIHFVLLVSGLVLLSVSTDSERSSRS